MNERNEAPVPVPRWLVDDLADFIDHGPPAHWYLRRLGGPPETREYAKELLTKLAECLPPAHVL